MSHFGRNSVKYSNLLNQKGIAYWLLYDSPEAEKSWLQVKEIRGKTLGTNHPEYCGILINLGALYEGTGQYEKAEVSYLEAKGIFEAQLNGTDATWYFNCVANLGTLYCLMGNFEKAERVFLETLERRKKANKTSDTGYAGDLNNLAYVYSALGRFEEAQKLNREALAIYEKEVGKEHPQYASMLGNIAADCMDLGRTEEAFPLYLEALAITEKTLGKEHPLNVYTLSNLAHLYERLSRYLDAELLLAEGLNHTRNRLVSATFFLSEQELAKYVVTLENNGVNLSSYLQARETNEAQHGMLPNLAYDHTLFYKGFLLTAASRLNAPKMFSLESIEKNLQLKAYHRRLATEYAKPIADRRNVAELEEKANMVEKELAKTVAGYADAIRQVKWQEVQKALKKDEAAIEFVSFQMNFPQPSDSVMYAALLITSENPQPVFIPLFEEKQLV